MDDTPTLRSVSMNGTTSYDWFFSDVHPTIAAAATVPTFPKPQIVERQCSTKDSDAEAWTLKESDVPLVDPFQVIEKTSIVLKLPAQTLINRMEEFVRQQSFNCTFTGASGIQNEVRFDCRTNGLLYFTVYFWRSPEDGGIVVEMQRRSGCCIEMHHVKCNLFHFLKTGSVIRSSSLKKPTALECPELVKKLYESRNCGESKDDSTSQDKSFTEDLENCRVLLESSYEDQKRLGMESLAILSEKNVAAEQTTKQVCECLLREDGPLAQAIRDEVSFYLNSARTNESSERYENPDEFVEGMKCLALKVVTNALENASQPGMELCVEFFHTIEPMLRESLRMASSLPNEAAMSARCLHRLGDLTGSDALFRAGEEAKVLAALLRAHEYGKAHHRELERESRDLLNHYFPAVI